MNQNHGVSRRSLGHGRRSARTAFVALTVLAVGAIGGADARATPLQYEFKPSEDTPGIGWWRDTFFDTSGISVEDSLWISWWEGFNKTGFFSGSPVITSRDARTVFLDHCRPPEPEELGDVYGGEDWDLYIQRFPLLGSAPNGGSGAFGAARATQEQRSGGESEDTSELHMHILVTVAG